MFENEGISEEGRTRQRAIEGIAVYSADRVVMSLGAAKVSGCDVPRCIKVTIEIVWFF